MLGAIGAVQLGGDVGVEVALAGGNQALAIELAQHERRKKDLLDLLVVGGVSLAALVRDPAAVPPEVARAFELAYPGLAASGETFTDAVQRMSADEVVGLVHGVKGKLFEMELASWVADESLWPQKRNLKLFWEWFDVEIHLGVLDSVAEEIRNMSSDHGYH